jgi:hypothetical protein
MNYLNFSYKQLDLLVSSLFLVYTTFHVSFFKTNVHNIKNINLVTFAFTTTRRASTLETNDLPSSINLGCSNERSLQTS